MLGLIDAAQAATTATPTEQSPFGMIFLLGGFFLIFYFLVWRPQSKRAKDQQELLASLKKGDEVVTSGGIFGQIVKVADHHVIINIAENLDIKVQKNAISSMVPKGTMKTA